MEILFSIECFYKAEDKQWENFYKAEDNNGQEENKHWENFYKAEDINGQEENKQTFIRWRIIMDRQCNSPIRQCKLNDGIMNLCSVFRIPLLSVSTLEKFQASQESSGPKAIKLG